MAQFDFGEMDADVETGTTLALILDTWRDALYTQHSGTSRPGYVVAGMIWSDDTVATVRDVYMYDGAADILLYSVDFTSNEVDTPLANLDRTGGLQDDIIFFDAGGSGDWIRGTIADLTIDLSTDVGSSILADANVAEDLTLVGATINDTTIGAITPSTGAFTTLSSSSLTTANSLSVTTTSTFTGIATFTVVPVFNAGFKINSASTIWNATETDGATASDSWYARMVSRVFEMGALDDDFTDANPFISVTRGASDSIIDTVTLFGTVRITALNTTGAVDLNSASANVDFHLDSTVADALALDADGSGEANGLLTSGVPFQQLKGSGKAPSGSMTTIEIAANVIAINHEVDWLNAQAQTGIADDLETITGGYDGQEIVVQASFLDTITIKHNTGSSPKFINHGSADIVAGSLEAYKYRLQNNFWYQL